MEAKQFIFDWIEANSKPFNDAADVIWQAAELGMEEKKSTAALITLLEANGFTVEKGVAGMPTAFVATFGKGKPVIGFSAEYDALPGLSQEIGTVKKAVKNGAPGHGCGHNLLGTAEVYAAVALKEALENKKIDATVKVFGTPAEELCIGKPFMAKAGLFKGLDVLLDWHPWNYNRADYDACNAYFNVKYHFKGKTSHGNSPWYGRSTLDAAMLMAHAVELLREHIRPSTAGLDAANTINYTFSDVGPEFPSVVPDRTTAWYVGRFDQTELMVEVMERIDKCAKAAAMATDTTVEIELITATHDKIPNKALAEVMHKNLEAVGTPKFTAEEQEFAAKMQREVGVPVTGLDETIMPFGGGSTVLCDTSEYSWFVPYVTLWVTLAPAGLGWHNWVVASCAGSPLGKKAMKTAAKVLAATAFDTVTNPTLVKAARAELDERLSTRNYIPVLPGELTPPLDINKAVMDKYR
ncbi:p-aminobenzoyl-glutamate hydrolase subunit B [bioreactor metagenome]|uniref:p-aminobenzoyl-glutamate hydrolase subunit B n=1 Tax=bioreactor metagenome TaxID=1076179 RepID=A0A644Y501_9ZZZZ